MPDTDFEKFTGKNQFENKLLFLYLLLLNFGSAQARIFPGPDTKLNYTQVMFEYDDAQTAEKYVVQIIEDSSQLNFDSPLIEQTDSSTATLISGLNFGKKYIWRYGAFQKKEDITWSAPIHFEVRGIPEQAFSQARLKILDSKQGHMSSGLLLIDDMKAAFDYSGKPVWFLSLGPHEEVPSMANDLRLNGQGMISYLSGGKKDVVCDLNGNVKWQYPNAGIADTTMLSKVYHHDFQRLPNGNYMLITNDKRWEPIPSYVNMQPLVDENPEMAVNADLVKVFTLKNGLRIRKFLNLYEVEVEYGAVFEIDSNYKIVWQWDSENYLNKTGIFKVGNGPKESPIEPDPHLNAFCVDDSNKFVYLSFRNLSRVVKIDKNTGKVLNSWGCHLVGGAAEQGNGFFHLQHAIALTPDNNLLVFDNEDTAKTKKSEVVVFTDAAGNDTSKIVWSYTCNFDSSSNISDRGGNVEQLPNGDFLVCMGGIPRIFELTRDKKIVWNAMLDKESPSAKVTFQLYRVHYASSLYPCYFSVSLNKQNLKPGDKSFPVKVFNKGSENDSYIIEIRSGGAQVQFIHTSLTKPGESGVYDIPRKNSEQKEEQLVIKISSVTNPEFQRTKFLTYQER